MKKTKKKYYIDYYINKYLNIIECNDLDIKDYEADIVIMVTDHFNKYYDPNDMSKVQNINSKFAKYAKTHNIKKYEIFEIFALAKKDKKYYRNLCISALNISLIMTIGDMVDTDYDNIEGLKKELFERIQNINIDSYETYDDFSRTIACIKQPLLIKYEIEKNRSSNINTVVKNKKGKKSNIDSLKKKYVKRYINKYIDMDYLSKDKLKNYIEQTVYLSVDDYFLKERNTTLDTYLASKMNRGMIKLSRDIGLIIYARLTGDIDYAVNNYLIKYSYLIENKEDEEILKKLILEIIDDKTIKRGIKVLLERTMNKLRYKFDIDIARNGSEEERKNQKQILIDNNKHLIELQSSKYTYYDYEDVVNKNIENIFYETIDSYINGTCTKYASNYLSTTLNSKYARYSNRTYEDNYLAIILLAEMHCALVLEKYYNEHDLSYTKQGNLEEYLDARLDEYINQGSYKQDISTFIDEEIKRYEEIDDTYRLKG